MDGFAVVPFQMPQNVLSSEDLADGQEDFPVTVVNDYSRDKLMPFTYVVRAEVV